MNPLPLDLAIVCLFGVLLWCLLALRDRARELAEQEAAREQEIVDIQFGGRDEGDRFRDKRRQAVIVVQWCRKRLQRGLQHDCDPPDVGKLVVSWCSQLDAVEICALDIMGPDALAQHFLGLGVPGLPPVITTNFADFRRTHAYERRQIRDEIEAHNATRQAAQVAAAIREREGKSSGGGPRVKAPAKGLA